VILGIVGLVAFPGHAGLARIGSTESYGPDYWQTPSRRQLSFDEAVTRFQNYVSEIGNKDLAVMEVMEFEDNFYAIVYEKSTGVRLSC
jgi:hypothetical protein